MVTLRLSIPAPVFCLWASVGTVTLILTLREKLGCGLGEAKGHVDRCVSGETVELVFTSRDEAVAVQQAALLAAPDLLVATVE